MSVLKIGIVEDELVIVPIGADLESQADQQHSRYRANREKCPERRAVSLSRRRMWACRSRGQHRLRDHCPDGEKCKQEPIDQQRGYSSHSR